MTPDEIRAAVLRAVHRVAPEADPAALEPDVPLRDQLDLGPLDFLRFVIELHESLGVDVPEADYASLATLDDCVEYLAAADVTHPTAEG